MEEARLKQIKIKTGILRRAIVEKDVYEKEVETEKNRLERMKNENRDEYELRKQEQVINESLMMLPDSQKRIYRAYNDLKNLLQEAETDLGESNEFELAMSTLKQAEYGGSHCARMDSDVDIPEAIR